MGGPNQEMIAFWNGPGGASWASNVDDQDRDLQAIGDAGLAALAPAPGESVLDVGCGPGTTTLAVARHVGAQGHVVGIDVSAPLLALARERAGALTHVAFVEADAQTAKPPGAPFDAVFSRFGVMFFDHPEAAFANLRASTSPGGRLTFVCWANAADNPWAVVPMAAITGLPGLNLPPPPDPDSPGPFAFADPDRVTRILTAAGWSDVAIRSYTDEIVDDLDRRVAFIIRQGPAARALIGAPDDLREAATGLVRNALAGYVSADRVRLGRSAWIVTARPA